MASRPVSHQVLVAAILLVIVVCGGILWHTLRATPAQGHVEAGIRRMEEKNPRAAEGEWQKAVSLEPDNLQAWQLLGSYYRATQNWPEAARAFSRVVQLDASATDARAGLAMSLLQSNDIYGAKKQAQSVLEQKSDEEPAGKRAKIAALTVLAEVAQREEDNAARSKYLLQLAQLQPRDVGVLETLAPALLLQNDYAGAQKVAGQILKLQPDSFVGYRVRGIARFEQDPGVQSLQLAKADLEKVLQLEPGDIQAHRYLGRIAMRLNQPLQAISHFESVGRGRPYASAHFMELAAAYRKAGREQQATALVARLVKLDEFNTQLRDLSSRFARKDNKFDNAILLGELLLQSVREGGDAYHLFAYRYEKNKVEAADFYLRAALELRPQSARAQSAMNALNALHRKHLQAAESALKTRDVSKADENLSHALLLHPLDARTLQAVQQLAQLATRNPLLPSRNSISSTTGR